MARTINTRTKYVLVGSDFSQQEPRLLSHYSQDENMINAYKQGKKVTAKRLYLETLEDVLSKSDTVIIDPSAKGSNVLPILPLN